MEGPDQDIGVGSATRVGRASGARRVLPRWVALGLALAIGWLLGALMNSEPAVEQVEQEPVTEEPVTKEPVTEEPVTEEPVPAPIPSFLEEVPVIAARAPLVDRATVVMVQAPLRGVAIPADITVIEDGVSTRIDLDRQIAGATQSVIGQGDRRMLVVGNDIAFMALNAVMVFDPVRKTEPVEVATAIHLLPGSEEGRAWAVTSGSRTVIDIDVRRRVARAEYDLSAIGTPLGSYSGGLVVTPANRSLGSFALWSPARGIEKLWSMHEDTTFIGAAGNVLVVHTPQGLASYNAVTGALSQTDVDILPSAQRRSIVSPDGSLLAVAQQGSVTELPTVTIIDTATGEQVDSFQAAFAWQLQWVSNTEVLFMLPANQAVSVMLRDTATTAMSLVTDLVGPNFWVTIAP